MTLFTGRRSVSISESHFENVLWAHFLCFTTSGVWMRKAWLLACLHSHEFSCPYCATAHHEQDTKCLRMSLVSPFPGLLPFSGTGKVKKMNNIKLAENTLGQRIKAQRIKMGYTQEQLAEEMCVPKSTISAYENDKVDIKSSVIVELSNKLGTIPNYLLGFEKKNDFSDSIAALVSNVTEDKVRTLIFKQIRSILDCFTV